MNNSKFTEDVESFLQCIKFDYGKVEGVTSYLPYYNSGVIFDALGYKEYAKEYYKKCGNYNFAISRMTELK